MKSKRKTSKKVLFLILYTVFIAAAVCGITKLTAPKDNIVFEMIRNDQSGGAPPPKGLSPRDVYYALLDDNSLLQISGHGQMSTGMTYAAFFYYPEETVIVKLTDEEAKALKKDMKKLVKNYKPVPYDYYYSSRIHDGVDITLKYNGKYYNSYEPKSKNTESEPPFHSFELEMLDIIKNYQEKYKDGIEDHTYNRGNNTLYAYWQLQEKEEETE